MFDQRKLRYTGNLEESVAIASFPDTEIGSTKGPPDTGVGLVMNQRRSINPNCHASLAADFNRRSLHTMGKRIFLMLPPPGGRKIVLQYLNDPRRAGKIEKIMTKEIAHDYIFPVINLKGFWMKPRSRVITSIVLHLRNFACRRRFFLAAWLKVNSLNKIEHINPKTKHDNRFWEREKPSRKTIAY